MAARHAFFGRLPAATVEASFVMALRAWESRSICWAGFKRLLSIPAIAEGVQRLHC